MRHYQTCFFADGDGDNIVLAIARKTCSLEIHERADDIPSVRIFTRAANLPKLTRAVAAFNAIMSEPDATQVEDATE